MKFPSFRLNLCKKIDHSPGYSLQQDVASSSQQREPEPRSLLQARPRSLTQRDHANPQLQSPLIARIPPELRVLVYEQVLGRCEADDVLHLEPADGILKYCRCFDRGTDKLGFRHPCWKVSWTKEERAKYGYAMLEPMGDENLLSIVLACRLITDEGRYMESIDILYSCNTFDMRRAESINLLPKMMLPHRFQAIRSIHFSTAFQCPIRPDSARKYRRFPPDYVPNWLEACQTLASLNGLTDLQTTLAVWPQVPGRAETIDDDSLYFLLEPLRAVTAQNFTVTITAELSDAVEARLGTLPFVLLKRERPGIGFSAVHSDD